MKNVDRRKDRRKLAVLGAALLAVLLSFAYASVFAYEPVTITASPVPAPLQFRKGSGADHPDLKVDIGPGNASLNITVNSTKHKIEIVNVSYVENTDGKAYHVTIRVNAPLTLPPGSKAFLLVHEGLGDKAKLLKEVDLLATGDTVIGSIPAGGKWRMDLKLESKEVPRSSTASLQLIYSTRPGPDGAVVTYPVGLNVRLG